MSVSSPFSVAEKAVLVTGASRGIGRAIALGFLEAGAIVLAAVRRPEKGDWQIAPEHRDRWHLLECDLADPASLASLPERAWEAGGGRLDGLVNNAGITLPGGTDPYDPALMRVTQAVLVDAPYYLCGRIASSMARRGGGSIVNVTSINAHLAFPGNPAYVTSKGALHMLTKAVALDFGAANVRANNLCPGYIQTDMTSGSYANEERRDLIASRTMLGRWGTPEDLVGPALFLVSDGSKYITGADLFVDGGWTAKGL
jgi:NAD(P)-dependent dehydrogenase (short-subunit alcohol dehydrogenase family)